MSFASGFCVYKSFQNKLFCLKIIYCMNFLLMALIKNHRITKLRWDNYHVDIVYKYWVPHTQLQSLKVVVLNTLKVVSCFTYAFVEKDEYYWYKCNKHVIISICNYAERCLVFCRSVEQHATVVQRIPSNCFLPCNAMLARYMLSSCVSPSVCHKLVLYQNG